jgi:ferredoxin, 2Fe-2S
LRTGAAIRFVEGCRASPMTKITFVDRKNNARIVNVVDGDTVMRAAVDLGIKGIVAECGGNAICATCHVYVDEPGFPKSLPPGAMRACCSTRPPLLCYEIRVTPILDGLTLSLPDKQL